MRRKLGDALVRTGGISEDQLRVALAEHERTHERIGQVLVRMNIASERVVSRALAQQLGFDYVELGETALEPQAIAAVPETIAAAFGCIGVRRAGNTLTVAMSAPFEFGVIGRIEEASGCHVIQVLASRMDILDAIGRAYPARAESSTGSDVAKDGAEPDTLFKTAPPSAQNVEDAGSGVVEFIVRAAIDKRASAIHVESIENDVIVRYRVEGALSETMRLPDGARAALVGRLKLMAGLQAEERHLPQTGRVRLGIDGVELDLRLSRVRTPTGEKLTLRLAHPRTRVPDIESLGLSPAALARLQRLLAAEHGLIVVAGPRGSGRSTTLGSIAATLGAAIRTAVVAEMPGSSLAPVPPQAPAAVLLGDIDDERIAAHVVNADRRGPLLLGAIEAEDLAAAACRLGGLGVPATAIASTLVGVITQRLVRRLCESCRQPFEPNAGVLEALNLPPGDALQFYGTVGCDACDYSGFRGRVALFEVLEIDGELRRLIAQSASEAEIRAALRAGDMATLADEGLASVKAGITTANELLRHVRMTDAPRPLCVGCGVALENDYVACPRCATRRYAPCGRCGRALQPDWRVCPYCERVVSARG